MFGIYCWKMLPWWDLLPQCDVWPLQNRWQLQNILTPVAAFFPSRNMATFWEDPCVHNLLSSQADIVVYYTIEFTVMVTLTWFITLTFHVTTEDFGAFFYFFFFARLLAPGRNLMTFLTPDWENFLLWHRLSALLIWFEFAGLRLTPGQQKMLCELTVCVCSCVLEKRI